MIKMFINKVASPITNNIISFCIYFVLQLFPIYRWILTLCAQRSIIQLLLFFSYLFLFSYFICALGELLSGVNRHLKRYYHIIMHIILYSAIFVALFCDRMLITDFNSLCISLIMETNSKEISDFFSIYVFNLRFLSIIGVITAIMIFEYALYTINKKYKNIRSAINYILSSIFVAVICFSIFIFLFKGENVLNKTFKTNSFYRFYNAVKSYSETKDQIPSAIYNTKQITIDSCKYSSSNIVMIIGESYNKHHSSLYGYELETNPKLKSLINNGLYIFDNVITTSNFTTVSFQNFLSFNEIENSEGWYNAPLFPAFFKRSGYNVTFYSNQLVIPDQNNKAFNAIIDYYLQHPAIDSCLFNNRNNIKFQYDGDLLNYFKTNRSTLERDSLNFTILHLLGQHMQYDHCFPDSFRYFTPDSIRRDDLTIEQKKIVSDYDNATLYNDSIVFEIIDMYKEKDAIVIYFADHGEEVYDYRDFSGRSFSINENSKKDLYYQFEIPFMIYMSDTYIKKHPDVAQNIKNAVSMPFTIDDIPHCILDLAGIGTKWFNPERSIVNRMYNPNRDRYVTVFGSNKIYNYDEICSK